MPAEGVKWARRWPEARAAMRQEEERWLVLIVDPIMAGRRDVGHRLQEGRQVYVRFTMYGRLCWSTMRAAQPTSWWRSGSVEPAPRLEPERAGD